MSEILICSNGTNVDVSLSYKKNFPLLSASTKYAKYTSAVCCFTTLRCAPSYSIVASANPNGISASENDSESVYSVPFTVTFTSVVEPSVVFSPSVVSVGVVPSPAAIVTADEPSVQFKVSSE